MLQVIPVEVKAVGTTGAGGRFGETGEVQLRQNPWTYLIVLNGYKVLYKNTYKDKNL